MENLKNKLFVNNLPYSVDDEALLEMFSGIEGINIVEAKVIVDKFNGGRSRGFGFVTVDDEDQAQKCIDELNGKEVDGRQVFVNFAKPQEKRDDRRPNNFNRSYR